MMRQKPSIAVINAGNGPGIGGSKRDSEIGDALVQGHPVYFILFPPEPIPGQTLGDVEKAGVSDYDVRIEEHCKYS